MKDVIGTANMAQEYATYFTVNRFGNPNSALALNGGWTQVPPGIYFDTPEFTISVWVYPQQVGNWSRVIDFGNGLGTTPLDNVVLRLDSNSNNLPALNIAVGTQNSVSQSTKALSNATRQLLTAAFNGSLQSFYINGTLVCNKSINYSLPKIARSYNYIGKSYNPLHEYSWSFIDDLRFYNKSLSQSEILELMNQNETLSNHF